MRENTERREEKKTTLVTVTLGVRQGSVLSQTLFASLLTMLAP